MFEHVDMSVRLSGVICLYAWVGLSVCKEEHGDMCVRFNEVICL